MLELRNISKSYPDFKLYDISFRVDDGDYFIILGPSGAGKTQILEIIAGLVHPDEGGIFINERDITEERIQSRGIGLVFQDYAVFPHMKVRENLAYSLRRTGNDKGQIARLVAEQAEAMEIGHLLDRRPSTLSGGELQRVALARTLIRKPRYLLLDEPLASLDVSLRQGLRSLLKQLNQAGQTIVQVTHDYEEALVLADKVAVIHQGKIIQSGKADDVFHHPGSEFVARFTGIRNYFPARLFREEDRQYGELENGAILRLTTDEPEGRGFILIRGEDIFISLEDLPTSATNRFSGRIAGISPSVYGFEVLVDTGTLYYVRITRESLQNLGLHEGKEVWISFKASNVRFVRV
ncbi:MAG: ABC transporter ATP-binding protein [Bacteroidales bacterium]|nr:ABC transporter ATP-binding protein [Bacteroidales bacterium]